MSIVPRKDTLEARAFWEHAEKTARKVESWPAWKRGESEEASTHNTPTSTERQTYLRQIERLQEQNRLLAEVIADERRLRHRAVEYYSAELEKWKSPKYRIMVMLHLLCRQFDFYSEGKK